MLSIGRMYHSDADIAFGHTPAKQCLGLCFWVEAHQGSKTSDVEHNQVSVWVRSWDKSLRRCLVDDSKASALFFLHNRNHNKHSKHTIHRRCPGFWEMSVFTLRLGFALLSEQLRWAGETWVTHSMEGNGLWNEM